MKILHIVNKLRGGYGTILKHLKSIGEEVLERKTEGDKNYNDYDFIILHSYLEDFDFSKVKTKKVFFVHGMGGVSRRYILGKFEYNPLRWYKRWKIIKWFKSNFDYFISITQSMSLMFKRLYNINSVAIYGGLNFDLLPNLNSNKKENIIAFIGKDDWFKGSDRFFKLMEMLPNFEGYFIGPYSKNNYIPKNVKIIGYVENPYEFLVKSKFLVVVSYFEPFSIATLEALFYNIPVLCLKQTGGTWEILQILGIPLGFNNLYEMADFIRKNENFYQEFKFNRELFFKFFDIRRFNRDLRFYLEKLGSF